MSKLNLSPTSTKRKQSRLNRETSLNRRLHEFRQHIIEADEKGLPRFGVLSVLARRVPFYLYDHPAIVALCDTAFTDGIHVFVNTEFFKSSLQEDSQRDEFGLKTHSTLLILLHELCHILFRHHARLPAHAPPLLWAIACDIAINMRLIKAYPKLRPGAIFKEAWGTKASEIERYWGHAEEQVLNDLWENPPPESKPFVDHLKQQLNQSSHTNIDRHQDNRGQTQDVHQHMLSLEKLAKTMDENGLQHVRETLQLPDPNDRDAYQKLHALNDLYMVSDLDKTQQLREAHPVGDAMAGSHLEASFSEWVDNQYQGQVEWKSLLRDWVIGEGLRYEHCDEVPADIYYVPPEQMQLDIPLLIGSQTPAAPQGQILCIIDTSKSVNPKLLALFLAELRQLVEHEDMQHGHLYLSSADTALRGDMMHFSQQDLNRLPETLLLHGRGGTDITRVINQCMQWLQQQNEFAADQLEAIIYLSDLLDKAPLRESLPEQLPKLLFLSPPSLYLNAFKNRVADFAEVAEIKEGTVIDLVRH